MNSTPWPDAGERADLAHHLALVAEVEARGRLVEHDELRLLRQRARQQHELALAAGDHGVGPLREMRDAESLERARRDRAVVRRRPAEQVAVRGAAHQHHGLDREGEGRHVDLRHIGDAAARARGSRTPRASGRRSRTSPACGVRMPSRVLSSVVLPPPFGPSSASTSPCVERDVEPAPDHAVAVADGEVAAGEASRPVPLHAGEQPDEERRADHRGEDAERNLDRRHGARQRVDEAADSRRRAAPRSAGAAGNPGRPARAPDAAPPGRPSR